MIRGVSFRISQDTKTVLSKIFSCLDTTRYYWHIIDRQTEVWCGSQGEAFFRNNSYEGDDFLTQIQSDHYIVFLKIQAYCNAQKIFDIHTYEEFEISPCQLLILVYDCEFVEIYVKDEFVATLLYDNVLDNHFVGVEYITENNDKRTKMDVL